MRAAFAIDILAQAEETLLRCLASSSVRLRSRSMGKSMKTMKAMKTKNTMKTTSMNAMKAMKTKKTKKKPAAAPRIKVEVKEESVDTPLHPTWPETPIVPPFIPFVFDNSLEDGPKDERDALLLRVGYALFQWRTRQPCMEQCRDRPKWMRGARPDQVEDWMLVSRMLDNGICLSLRDPPTFEEHGVCMNEDVDR